jgi:alpha-tubulin suppressor-like RCC1 family protein
MTPRLAALAVVLGFAGCGDPVTQLVVVVDTDYTVPDEIDTIRFLVGPDGTAEPDLQGPFDQSVGNDDDPELPLAFTLLPGEGVRVVEIVVMGIGDGAEVIRRKARVSFGSEASLQIRIDLLRGCEGLTCDAETTCNPDLSTTECTSIDRDDYRTGFDGTPTRLDGGVDTDAGCDCSGETPVPNATFECVGGGCVPTCNYPFDDCNGDLGDGCETRLVEDPFNCGECENVCEWGLDCDDRGACDEVSDLALGRNHTCASTAFGHVYCWGSTEWGQVGNGVEATGAVTTPTRVWDAARRSVGATDVDAFGDHTCVATSDNDVWCWGANPFGQIGNGTSDINVPDPARVMGLDTVTVERVATGNGHSCALYDGGQVTCWGGNDFLALGAPRIVTFREVADPTAPVPGVDGAVLLSGGENHTCAKLSDGRVFCWGRNDEGQLGQGNVSGPAGAAPVVLLRAGELSGAEDLNAGATGGCALGGTGELSCWGANGHGEVGNGGMSWARFAVTLPQTDWSTISMGHVHTCATKLDERVFCWGSENNFRVGNPTMTTGYQLTPLEVPGFRARFVEAGDQHTCAVRADGDDSGWVYCWGGNGFGQLGTADGVDRPTPMRTAAPAPP